MPYRQIHTSIWAEDWFEPMSSHAKLLSLYLMCHPGLSPAGFVTATPPRISFDTSIPIDTLSIPYSEIQATGRFRLFESHLWWVVRSLKYQGKGEKWEIAIRAAVSPLPPNVQEAFFLVYDQDTLTPSPSPLTPVPLPRTPTQQNTTEHSSIATLPIPHPCPSDTLSLPHRRFSLALKGNDAVHALQELRKSDDWEKWSAARPGIDLELELDKCAAHWAPKGFKDPLRAWLNWLSKGDEFRLRDGAVRSPAPSDAWPRH